MTRCERLGKIVRLYSNGRVGYIRGEGKRGRLFCFTFELIEGYKGEPPSQLKRFSSRGLEKGVLVKFEAEANCAVKIVRPLIFRD